jgi:hypothetical protein
MIPSTWQSDDSLKAAAALTADQMVLASRRAILAPDTVVASAGDGMNPPPYRAATPVEETSAERKMRHMQEANEAAAKTDALRRYLVAAEHAEHFAELRATLAPNTVVAAGEVGPMVGESHADGGAKRPALEGTGPAGFADRAPEDQFDAPGITPATEEAERRLRTQAWLVGATV